jgi:hypothetical protein
MTRAQNGDAMICDGVIEDVCDHCVNGSASLARSEERQQLDMG